MSSDSSLTPRDAQEARLTALLLGELTTEEAEQVRQALAQDPALARLHERLKQTVGLVREAAKSAEETATAQPVAPKLSPERRERLLRSFKVVRPEELFRRRQRQRAWRSVAAMAAMLMCLGALGLLLWRYGLSKERPMASITLGFKEEASEIAGLSVGRRSSAPAADFMMVGQARNLDEHLSPPTSAGAPSFQSLRREPQQASGFALYLPDTDNDGLLAHASGVEAKAKNDPLDRAERFFKSSLAGASALAEPSRPESGGVAGGFAGRGRGAGGLPAGPSADAPRPAAPASPSLGLGDLALLEGEGRREPPPASAKPAGPPLNQPASADVTVMSERLRERLDVLDRKSEGAGDLAPLPIQFPAESRKNLAAGAPVKPSPPAPPTIGSGPAALAFQNLDGIELAPLPIQFPAPTLKGTPAELPSGPHLEPLTDKPAGTRIVGLPDSPAKPAVPPLTGPASAFGLSQLAKEDAKPAEAPPGAADNRAGFSNRLRNLVARSEPEQPAALEAKKAAAPADALQLSRGEPAAQDRAFYAITPPSATPPTQLGVAVNLWDELDQDSSEKRPAVGSTAKLAAETASAEEPARRLAELETRPRLERERLARAKAAPDQGVPGEHVHSLNAVGYVTNTLLGRDTAGTVTVAGRPVSEVTAGKRVDVALPSDGAEVSRGAAQVPSVPAPSPTQPVASEPGTHPPQRSPNAPVPQPEVLSRDNAFSTFSLNVSDVSFKLAAASLEKGALPDVATVRSEEFINAFDYRDPEPAPGVPIAFAWERARYPFAHNRDLLRFSIKTAARGRQPGRPLNLVLLLDNSGSMERADRVRIIQECLLVLAAQLQPQDRVSVVTFARTARLWADGVPGYQVGPAFERVGTLTPEGGTNLEEALNLAYQTARRHFLAQGVNRVVLLTDGAANLGNVEPDALKQKVESFRRQGIALDCFGIGWEGFNDDLLEVLSRHGDGRYGFVNTPEEAATEFAGQLAGALKVAASDVKVQVEFNPRRVTAYRQIGYAKHQLKKEQFRDNTVDAAEIGAAEAGNALYVVEVDPRGQGPLAVVRVRYKVPGTSDYREHEWPVPFTGVAVPLEQASPALRLAATASAFSEWLVASPYAAEVTLDRLLHCLQGVPEAFGADPRPRKLEWMIRQAKSLAGK